MISVKKMESLGELLIKKFGFPEKIINRKSKNKQLENAILEIKKENITMSEWCNKDTFMVYIELPKKLKDYYKNIIPKNNNEEYSILGEYWRDEHSYHYILEFYDGYEEVPELACTYLNNLIHSLSKEQKMFRKKKR